MEVALIIFVPIALTFIFSLAIRMIHNRRIQPDAATPIHTEPPDDLSPAEIGAIFDHHIGTDEFFATLYDLVHRGYLRIGTVIDEGNQTIRDFSIASGKRIFDDQLALHESIVLRALMPSTDQSTTLLTYLGGYMATSTAFPLAVQAVLEKKGYYKKSSFNGLLLLVAFIVAVPTSIIFMPLVLPIIICPIVYVLLVGNRITATPKISQLWPQLLGFKKYIQTVATDRAKFHAAVDGNLDIVEREFAYVVAFKQDRAWQKAINDLSERLKRVNKDNKLDKQMINTAVQSIRLQQQFIKEIGDYKNS